MKKSYKNFGIIFLLGISSGLPISLILSTLKAFLLDQGFDIKTIGFFSLVSLPYTLKFFFAPFIDSYSLPILAKTFGHRKSWIIFTQLLLAIFIAALGSLGLIGSLPAIATFSLLIAIASASQDIVIDGYRIELIKKEDQGLAAGFYVYGYRLGNLVSGALALALSQVLGWSAVYFLMAIFMLSCVIIAFLADETRTDFQAQKNNFFLWFKNFVTAPILHLTAHRSWFVILLFIVFFKLGDVFAGNLTIPFLLEMGFSKIEIASILKTFGLFATLFGVFVGGILVKKFGLVRSLWIGALMQSFSNLAFVYLAKIGYDPSLLYLVVFAENFSGGIGDTVFVAYLSSLCSVAFGATQQYALLVSLASFSRTFLSSSAGIFAQSFGWYWFFIFSTFLALPGLLFLLFLTAKKTTQQFK